jgi:hypothetical protein
VAHCKHTEASDNFRATPMLELSKNWYLYFKDINCAIKTADIYNVSRTKHTMRQVSNSCIYNAVE